MNSQWFNQQQALKARNQPIQHRPQPVDPKAKGETHTDSATIALNRWLCQPRKAA